MSKEISSQLREMASQILTIGSPGRRLLEDAADLVDSVGKVREENELLRAELKEISDDCLIVAEQTIVEHAERRTWHVVSAKALNALNASPPQRSD